MARKSYKITMTFISTKRPGWQGQLKNTVNAKSRVSAQIRANRNWLSAKGHTETSLTITDA